MSASTAAVAVMVAQRKRLIRHFEQASAFTPDTAISESTLPHAGFRLLAKLRDEGVIRAAQGGMLYLDRARWEEVSEAMKARAKIAVMVAVALSLMLIGYILTRTAA